MMSNKRKTGSSEWPWPASLDALCAAPDSHRLLMENEKVRVLEVTIPARHKEPWHTHRRVSLMLIDQSASIRYFRSDDDFDERPRRTPKDEMVHIEWLEPESIHCVENTDTMRYHAIRVELQKLNSFTKQVVCAVLLICFAVPCYSSSHKNKWKENESWGDYFQQKNVQGCFVLYDLQRNEYMSYNRRRVDTGFLPASTYKIFNSLVALETGAVRDETEVLKWDGIKRMFPAWNQDQNMREAMKNSTVWFYQEMARRIGQTRMQHYVNLAHYGNRDVGGGIDHFWLDGRLRIRAKEQIDLLVKLHRNQLPFSPRAINIVKDILTNEKTDNYILRAKTGWAGLGDKSVPQIGWWVGYVERANGAYFFAMNIDIKKHEDAAARMTITRNILREMNIIER
jgi:beta-lactamase class D